MSRVAFSHWTKSFVKGYGTPVSTSLVLDDEPPRRVGRPRDARIDEAVLRVAWDLLQEVPYAEVTLEEIAARAGVSRPALKRRWASKVGLVVDAVIAHTPAVPAADTGTLEGDLRACLEDIARVWSTPRVRLSYSALIAELDADPAATERFRELQQRRGANVADALRRAAARGEIDAGADVSLVADLLEGPVLHRRLISDLPATPALLEAALRSTLDQLGVRTPRDRRRP